MANDPTQPWPPSVIVRPPTRMFDDEDLGALVFGIVQQTDITADRVEIRKGYLWGDWAEPGWTWVSVVLDEAGRAAIGAIVTAIVMWGRDWIKKARERDPSAAPIKVVIYSQDGEILQEVEVPPEDG